MADTARAEQLDALNEKTFVKHHRRIVDQGLRGEDSALPGLLADLRANAETVYGEVAPAPARRTRAV